eukprot:365534-Chlamydomonas_euryale.AAC.4
MGTCCLDCLLATPSPARTLHTLVGEQSGAAAGHRQLFLRTPDGRSLELSLPPDAAPSEDLPLGEPVSVLLKRRSLAEAGKPLRLVRPPRRLLLAGGATGAARRLQQLQPPAGATAPAGNVSMVVFIMDLSPCGNAGPAATPEVKPFLTVFTCTCMFA